MPFEAFKVVPKGKKTKLEVDASAFKDADGLGKEVTKELSKVQGRLNAMNKYLGNKKGMSAKELEVANMIIEEELEDSIPNTFRTAYKKAGSWEAAAELIASNILTKVNKFIGIVAKTGKFKKTSLLKRMANIASSESWTEGLSESEVKDIYEDFKNQDADETESGAKLEVQEDAVKNFMARYRGRKAEKKKLKMPKTNQRKEADKIIAKKGGY